MMKRIAVYGKGGVGKTTICSNVAALLQRTEQVALVGCSTRADSTFLLLGERCRPTILEQVRSGKLHLENCIHIDRRNITCVETGGPEPAAGCAGRGVAHSLQMLTRSREFEKRSIDWAIYDVIADVVCGGFTEPMKQGQASEVYVVTSAELMSLYAANNVCQAILSVREKYGQDLRFGGLIHNRRGMANEVEVVERFADMIGVPVIAHVPRSALVQESEARLELVVEAYPDSDISHAFEELTKRIMSPQPVVPQPMPVEKSIGLLAELVRKTELLANSFVPVEHAQVKLVETETQASIDHPLKRVAIYGKAGIGKSTISANVSAALAEMGEQVLLVGCDPKHDSVALVAGRMVPTILDSLHAAQNDKVTSLPLEEVVFNGFQGVKCVESGGPPAGFGCAGQGVFSALEFLEKSNVFERYGITFATYDVLGEVVCGGFAQPIRGGFCRTVYVVTNGEPLSLLVANNVLSAMARIHAEGIPVGIGGIINNQRGVANEKDIVERFASSVQVPVIAHIPRSAVVQQAEMLGKTVIEAFPFSDQAMIYRSLAKKLVENQQVYVPTPVESMEVIFSLTGKQTS